MNRQWFAGTIVGMSEIENMLRELGPNEGDAISMGDVLVVRGDSGEATVYVERFTDWPDGAGPAEGYGSLGEFLPSGAL